MAKTPQKRFRGNLRYRSLGGIIMIEQLDLFYATAMQEEKPTEKELQEKFDKKDQVKPLTQRQKDLYNLIAYNSLVEHRKTTQREICDIIIEYEWKETSESTHDHCSAIWTDICKINLSHEKDQVIISDNFEYWIGNKEETKAFIDKLWSDLEPRLKRYWAYLKKIRRNGQGQMYDEETNTIDLDIRRFIESYGKARID